MYHYTEGGLRNVWLANGYRTHKTPHGQAVAIERGDELERELCRAISRKPGQMTGSELRFLRLSGFMLSQPALGDLIGVDGQTVARWEKSRLPRWADRLVRLLFAAKADGNEPICAAVERLQTVERAQRQRIELRSTKGEWRSSFKASPAEA